MTTIVHDVVEAIPTIFHSTGTIVGWSSHMGQFLPTNIAGIKVIGEIVCRTHRQIGGTFAYDVALRCAPKDVPSDWLHLRWTAVNVVGPVQPGPIDAGHQHAVCAIVINNHQRDHAGNLVCTGRCGQAIPYAEPPASGSFVCYSCRVEM